MGGFLVNFDVVSDKADFAERARPQTVKIVLDIVY